MVNLLNVFWGFFAFFIALVITVSTWSMADGIINLFPEGFGKLTLQLGMFFFYLMINIALPIMVIKSDENILERISKKL